MYGIQVQMLNATFVMLALQNIMEYVCSPRALCKQHKMNLQLSVTACVCVLL